MQTTGKVILNARGVNINGYDCFVNLSKDKDSRDLKFSFVDGAAGSIMSGYPSIKDKISTTNTKFSPCSYYFGNNGGTKLIFSNSTPASTYTLSAWVRVEHINVTPTYPAEKGAVGIIIGFSSNFVGNKNVNSGTGTYFWINGNTWVGTTISFDSGWHHFALICINSNRRIVFFDGVNIIDKDIPLSNEKIEYIYFRDYCCYQNIDDLVIIKDQALWTSNFTPPTTYLLDSDYNIDLNQARRRNIIAANVDKKLIIPDPDGLKQY